MDFSTTDDVIDLLVRGFFHSLPITWRARSSYGSGYDDAKVKAESLLDVDSKSLYAFVTDGVDGYLFTDDSRPKRNSARA